MDLIKSNADLINQHSLAIAGYSASIKYWENLGEADLLHDLKHLYETEKQRLEQAWMKVKAKGEEFLKEVLAIVVDFFSELVSDVLAFLKRHNLNDVIEFLKELF